MRAAAPLFAVVAPMHDTVGAIPALAAQIGDACVPLGPFAAAPVADGSTDDAPRPVARATAARPWLRVVRRDRRFGQSEAFVAGVRAARIPLNVAIKGDGQNPPADIPRLLAPLLASDRPAGPGLACGVRARRRDGAARRLASRAANAIRRALLRGGSADRGCGLKAFPRAAFIGPPAFDRLHRFPPALFKADGRAVRRIPLGRRSRLAGRSRYGRRDRAPVGAPDVFGVWWPVRRRAAPPLRARPVRAGAHV